MKKNKRKSQLGLQSNLLHLTYNINNNKYSKKDIIKINKQINQNEVFDTITNNVNNIGENEQQKRNIISKIQITRFYIYLCSCCI